MNIPPPGGLRNACIVETQYLREHPAYINPSIIKACRGPHPSLLVPVRYRPAAPKMDTHYLL